MTNGSQRGILYALRREVGISHRRHQNTARPAGAGRVFCFSGGIHHENGTIGYNRNSGLDSLPMVLCVHTQKRQAIEQATRLPQGHALGNTGHALRHGPAALCPCPRHRSPPSPSGFPPCTPLSFPPSPGHRVPSRRSRPSGRRSLWSAAAPPGANKVAFEAGGQTMGGRGLLPSGPGLAAQRRCRAGPLLAAPPPPALCLCCAVGCTQPHQRSRHTTTAGFPSAVFCRTRQPTPCAASAAHFCHTWGRAPIPA